MDYPDYTQTFAEPAQDAGTSAMANLVTYLLKARDTAHVHHWKVKSLSMHLALGELYGELLDLTDELFEMYMGKYGTDAHVELSTPNPFSEQDPLEFILQLFTFLEGQHDVIPQDKWLVNKFEELQGSVARVKYKLENLH
jgi:hypothetical protein